MQKNIICGYLLSAISVNAYTLPEYDYSPRIMNPSDGYLITISSNTNIASTPTVASDGKNYYQVGEPFRLNKSNASGMVKCIGKDWNPHRGQESLGEPAWHRLFVYVPPAGIMINNKPTYRINSNIIITVETEKNIVENWAAFGTALTCGSGTGTGLNQPINYFDVHFPITVTFYLQERIIDGQIPIPARDLAGYVRAFTLSASTPPPFSSWNIGETTAPVRLANSQINVGAYCETSTNTGGSGFLNLEHGALNSLNYNSEAKATVNYKCKFSSITNVKFRLDYARDEDPLKRVPMFNIVSPQNKIYSELVLVNDSTGEIGTELKASIREFQSITVRSTLRGTNAVAGNYQGSAWLIATFD